jgi:GT2 family glycosyltransferase
MITAVISTRKRDQEYLNHLKETAGVEVLFLCYENNREFSLTQLYQRGLETAKTDIVVFLHDDLIFPKNANWGAKLVKAFETTDYGILGKAGTIHFPKSAKWWEDANAMVGKVHHQAMHPKHQKIVRWASEYSFNIDNNVCPTVIVDGLMFAVHKQRIKHGFDTEIPGFHFYEIDFCLQNYLAGVKIGVVFDFDVTHKSIGETNQEWEINRARIQQKYAGKTPLRADIQLFVDEGPVKIKKKNLPLVSVIVPTKGNVNLVENLLVSMYEKVTYPSYEVIIADTGSSEEEKKALHNVFRKVIPFVDVKMVEYDYYNFGKINNEVVKNHISPKSELIVFCNNDIQFVNDCISRMVKTYQENKNICGTIGARLHFHDNSIQHAGIFIGRTKQTKHLRAGHIGYKSGYQYKNRVYEVVGNTAALLMVSKSLFLKIGGFNENYAGCFEDVELNLEMLVRRYKNFLCGDAVAYHLESQTRDGSIAQVDYDRLTEFNNKHFEKISPYILEI